MIIAFDFDNTLFCNARFLVDLKKLFNEFDVSDTLFDADYDYHKNIKALYSPFIQYKRLKKTSTLKKSTRAFRRAYHEKFSDLETYLHPGAINTLQELKKNHHLAVLSYGASSFQRMKIHNTGIARYFDRILISEDTKADEVRLLMNLWKQERTIFIDDKESYADEVKMTLPDVFVLQMHAACCPVRKKTQKIDGHIEKLKQLVSLVRQPASTLVPQIKVSELGEAVAAELSAKLLKQGKILAVPTETSYGLAADAGSFASVRHLYKVKTRSAAKMLPIMVKDLMALKQYCLTAGAPESWIPQYYNKTVSFRLKKRRGQLKALGSDPTVVARVATHSFLQKLAQDFHKPFTITSVNISSLPSVFSYEEYKGQFAAHIRQIDAFVNYGTLKEQAASTILDLTEMPPKILRQGKTKISHVS